MYSRITSNTDFNRGHMEASRLGSLGFTCLRQMRLSCRRRGGIKKSTALRMGGRRRGGTAFLTNLVTVPSLLAAQFVRDFV